MGYEIVNLGRGEPTLLLDFVRLIEEQAGRRAALTEAPMLAADVEYTFADITKARELLGYDPQTSVASGVREFYQWYRRAVLNEGGS